MTSSLVFYKQPSLDVEAKQRPLSLVVLDLHMLGILELDGIRTPRLIPIPPAEPGDTFELLLVDDYPMLAPLDQARPSLLPGPRILILDSAGDQGEIAAASLLT